MKWYAKTQGDDPMSRKDPPFRITGRIMSMTAEIGELLGKLVSTETRNASPTLRRANRIRSIYSSLAIEQNSLSLDQVTAVISGKRILAPPKDIREIQNAYEVYERMDQMDPFSVEDLLMAHEIMTRDLVGESGTFRSGDVGVVDGEGNILHFGTLPAYVPQLVMELLDWTEHSDLPILIRSCVFHYEFELIHPFADGNGRMGRLWQTLLLCQWNPLFAWLPVESIVHDRQADYYEAINQSNEEGESTRFIEFMLEAIKSTLQEAVQTADGSKSKMDQRWTAVNDYLRDHDFIQNAQVRSMFRVSSATANRILAGMCGEGKLEKIRLGRSWGYRKKQNME